MQPAKRVLEYVPDPNKFDLVVDRWDGQGQRVGQRNTYRKYITSQHGELYERPVNSGNLWYENNQPAGRVHLEFNDKGHILKKEFKIGEQHLAYVAPPTGAAKMAAELAAERAKSAHLEAELRAINKEREDKQPQATTAFQKQESYKQEPPKLSKN